MSSSPTLEHIKKLISESHQNPDDDLLQEKTIQNCFEYIVALPPSKHLFCDPEVYYPSIHALILFSFPDSEALTWYKQRITEYLDDCQKCLYMFHSGRARLRETFLCQRKLDFDSVTQFTNMILQWESSRIIPILRVASSEITKVNESLVECDSILGPRVMLTIIECLCGPGLLKQNSALSHDFKKVFDYLIKSKKPFKFTNNGIPAGLVHSLFEGTSTQRKWALVTLQEYSKSEKIQKSSFHAALREQFEINLINIQNPKYYNDETCSTFWRNMVPLMKALTSETLLAVQEPKTLESASKAHDFKVVKLTNVITNQIMSYQKKPLPFILRAFNCMIVVMKNEFWNQVKPLIANNFLDTIFGNPFYLKNLIELQSTSDGVTIENEYAPNLNDCLSWVNPVFDTISKSEQQRIGSRISDWFFKLSVDKGVPISSFTRELLVSLASDLLCKCLEINNQQPYRISFAADILARGEARNIVDKHCDFLVNTSFEVDSAFGNNENITFLRNSCFKIASLALQFDIMNFSQYCYSQYNKDSDSLLAPFSPLIWKKITSQSFLLSPRQTFDHSFLMISLLSSLKGLFGVVDVTSKDSSKLNQLTSLVNDVLSMFLDVSPNQMSNVLHDSNALDGLWTSILSPKESISKNATAILCDAFDSSGRFEGIQSILEDNFEMCINSLIKSLTNIISCGYYEPCPRAIRVLMDVVNSINDPAKGILHNPRKLSDEKILQKFWNKSWEFLVLIYQKTTEWATRYEAKKLIEFTRDTLDLSHLVLGCFLGISSMLSQGASESKLPIQKDLFQKVLDSFKSMMVWLRLNDSALLQLCVDLIVKTVDLAVNLDLMFTDEVVELMAKYGSKAKKFKNKLNDEQVTEILNRARIFNFSLVDKVVAESNDQKVVLSAVKTSQPSSTSVTPPPQELSKLEQLKLELRQNRPKILTGAKPLVIHPPSKSGFHSRKAKRDGESVSDSDSGSEPDEVTELFAQAKKEKAKTALLDKVPGRLGNLKKPSLASAAEEKRRKERNMKRRLNVSLDPFYEIILRWTYGKDSNFPDNKSIDLYDAVPNTFKDSKEYQKVFQPLLLLECWQSIISSRDMTQDKPFEILIASRASVDRFFDVYVSVSKTVIQERKLGESDLIVIAYIDDYTEAHKVPPSKFKGTPISCLAKVREIKSANSEFADVTLRISPDKNPMVPLLTAQSTILALKVTQMTTIEREYSSLHGLPYYDLYNSIISAKPKYSDSFSETELDMTIQNYKVNKSQAKAIIGSVNNKGFSLIQGPPGTGKTKTILGIIGHLLTSSSANQILTNIKVESSKKQKILVCAPSNAAVDELVLRMRSKIKDSLGRDFQPNVVRLGRSDAINSAVKDLTLEELVDKELSGKSSSDNFLFDASIRQELNKVLEERNRIRELLNRDDIEESKAVQFQLQMRDITRKKNELGRKLDEQREKQSIMVRNKDIERRNVQFKILSEANIICSTLSGSAHDIVKGMNITCETVIVDEACQCTELSAIIPLRYGCERCIMVGDPNQLPPTVISQAAASLSYERSLFVRMHENYPKSVYLLDVQYRMHPEISKFPSREFYDSRLIDGEKMVDINARGWHNVYPLSPYRFFDVAGKQKQSQISKSLYNMPEALMALELVKSLEKIAQSLKQSIDGKIGIISPYKEQIWKLKSVFTQHYGQPILDAIDFNTIDGFQGQEKEVIIMSCVRASGGGVGFLADIRRMNVGLTRAKTTLWILGHTDSLSSNAIWRALILDANDRNLVSKAYPGFLQENPESLKKNDIEFRKSVPARVKNRNANKFSKNEDGNKKDNSVIIDYSVLKNGEKHSKPLESSKKFAQNNKRSIPNKPSDSNKPPPPGEVQSEASSSQNPGKSNLFKKNSPQISGSNANQKPRMPSIYTNNKRSRSNNLPQPKRRGAIKGRVNGFNSSSPVDSEGSSQNRAYPGNISVEFPTGSQRARPQNHSQGDLLINGPLKPERDLFPNGTSHGTSQGGRVYEPQYSNKFKNKFRKYSKASKSHYNDNPPNHASSKDTPRPY